MIMVIMLIIIPIVKDINYIFIVTISIEYFLLKCIWALRNPFAKKVINIQQKVVIKTNEPLPSGPRRRAIIIPDKAAMNFIKNSVTVEWKTLFLKSVFDLTVFII